MTNPSIDSIQVGTPKAINEDSPNNRDERPWTSGIYKEEALGKIRLGSTNLAGDGQADLKNHGGPDKAVNVYPLEHYMFWRERLGLASLSNGGFGENFTTRGLLEKDVSIGDVYSVGEAKVQVSQPRRPCWKISRKWGVAEFADMLKETGRTGWYFRVIQEGDVKKGDEFTLIDRPCPEWTIALANDLMHDRVKDRAAVRRLARCPHLSGSWRKTLSGRGTILNPVKGASKNCFLRENERNCVRQGGEAKWPRA